MPATAGLVVVAVSDMGAKVEQAMKRAAKLEQKELKADTAEIERDAASATEAKGVARPPPPRLAGGALSRSGGTRR